MQSNDQAGNPVKRSSSRGFASMDPQRQREIASEGGRAAHERGTAHEFTSEEAREAGRKGGQARAENRSARQRASAMPSTESASDSGSNRGNASDR
ncbi:KGG domain-containing protein [Caenimonas terrae]|uniref:KGG domain-containing protein n=1 Tax=Caenimonas terrae TaxID=696074 RepID=A0ABW0NBE7_9BURK